jgi:gliding motility-associated-like protein
MVPALSSVVRIKFRESHQSNICMKVNNRNRICLATAIFLLFAMQHALPQSFGIKASAVWITDCNQSNFFNTSGDPADLIGPPANVFHNNNLGVHTQNSGSLVLRGARLKTFKNPVSSNICSANMYYRVYLQTATPGAFTSLNLPFLEDCNTGTGNYPSGGPCVAGDQVWNYIISNINLTAFSPGNYVLEVYYELSGSHTSTTQCDDLVTLNNSGDNYKALFSIQSPALSSTNPSSCFGNEGSITIGGLVPGALYQVTYTDDGVVVGPTSYTANGAGQIIISGLDHGFYSNIILQINGCTTNLFTGIILSDPVYVPTFPSFPPFCAGSTPPTLPTVSGNGITGTWNPSTVNNQTTGTYTFTPDPNQCGFPVSITITVIQQATPIFPFGTSLEICAGGTVPTLPNTSTNGITGTWNPAVVDNQNSGTYIFTPDAGQCASTTTFTVTVNPNITPVFDFGTTLTICAGGSVPTLPNTSTNGITGTWNPSVVDNQNSGTYTFTPDAGQCATTTTFTVTVNPNITPVFDFGTTLTICAGGTVPTLPNTSTNGITGTWNPSVVDNQNSGTYIFTPDAGQCATTTSFTVTVNPNITPVFDFGTTLTICAGGSVPVLPNTSANGITGTWNPAVVDNQNSGTYTFTPNSGECATGPVDFSVTVMPNETPAFDFGNSLSICAGETVPALPNTSTNGITGTWNPAIVSNQASGTYVFTPSAGICALPFTYSVTVSSIVTPVFAFGTFQSVCVGSTIPSLPGTSMNGITGVWDPESIDNQVSRTYTFTPHNGQCATTTDFTLEVNPVPTVNSRTDTLVYDGDFVPAFSLQATPGSVVQWTNSDPSIGLSQTGTGTVPSFTAINYTNAPKTATITATPSVNGCIGATQSYVITVMPLDKDVFVPNVFSPNGDGRNDILYVYGNYIEKVDMRIFNQWGQQVAQINNKTQGWNGTFKGQPQPVGVYVYILKAQLADGRKIDLKGSITLVR